MILIAVTLFKPNVIIRCFVQANAIITSSLDGSVRAFDLSRFQNFRTLVAGVSGVQFVSLAVDAVGAIVVAGSQGSENSAYVWSLQVTLLQHNLA